MSGYGSSKRNSPRSVSLEEMAICIVEAGGGIARKTRVSSEPEALVSFFATLGLALERVGLEACSLNTWLHEALTAAGVPTVCIETRQARRQWVQCRTRPTATMRAGSPRSFVLAGIVRSMWKPVQPVMAGATDGAPDGVVQAT